MFVVIDLPVIWHCCRTIILRLGADILYVVYVMLLIYFSCILLNSVSFLQYASSNCLEKVFEVCKIEPPKSYCHEEACRSRCPERFPLCFEVSKWRFIFMKDRTIWVRFVLLCKKYTEIRHYEIFKTTGIIHLCSEDNCCVKWISEAEEKFLSGVNSGHNRSIKFPLGTCAVFKFSSWKFWRK